MQTPTKPITQAILAIELEKNRKWLKGIDDVQAQEIREAALERLEDFSCRTQSAQIREVLAGMREEGYCVSPAKIFCEEVLSVMQKMGYSIEKGIESPNFRSLKTRSRKLLLRLYSDKNAKERGEKVDEAAFRNFVGVVEDRDFSVEVYSHRSGAWHIKPVIYLSNKKTCTPARTR